MLWSGHSFPTRDLIAMTVKRFISISLLVEVSSSWCRFMLNWFFFLIPQRLEATSQISTPSAINCSLGPRGSLVKELAWRRCRRLRFDPWVGKTPKEGNGDPLQCSCLGNPMGEENGWLQYVHRVTESWTWPSTHMHTHKRLVMSACSHQVTPLFLRALVSPTCS